MDRIYEDIQLHLLSDTIQCRGDPAEFFKYSTKLPKTSSNSRSNEGQTQLLLLTQMCLWPLELDDTDSCPYRFHFRERLPLESLQLLPCNSTGTLFAKTESIYCLLFYTRNFQFRLGEVVFNWRDISKMHILKLRSFRKQLSSFFDGFGTSPGNNS